MKQKSEHKAKINSKGQIWMEALDNSGGATSELKRFESRTVKFLMFSEADDF